MIFGFEPLELFGNLFAFGITILILLYAFGDSPLFRLATHIFIGVASGYAGGVAWHSIVLPHLLGPLVGSTAAPVSPVDLALRFLLVGLLLTKLSPRTAAIGNPATAFLVAVGAATAIGGAIQGTIFPLTSSAGGIVSVDTIHFLLGENTSDGLTTVARILFMGTILLGTITTLVYFQFSAKSAPNQTPERHQIITIISWIGKVFIAITFGALFAGVFISSLDALNERLFYLWDTISSLLLLFG